MFCVQNYIEGKKDKVWRWKMVERFYRYKNAKDALLDWLKNEAWEVDHSAENDDVFVKDWRIFDTETKECTYLKINLSWHDGCFED